MGALAFSKQCYQKAVIGLPVGGYIPRHCILPLQKVNLVIQINPNFFHMCFFTVLHGIGKIKRNEIRRGVEFYHYKMSITGGVMLIDFSGDSNND